MRLKILDNGHRLGARAFLKVIRPPDVVATHLYRPGFYGRGALEIVNGVMRGSSEWAVGERELFAAYTSKLNQCPF